MVDDEVRRSAEELRSTAEKLKLLARRTRSIHARDGLLALAERFERMARCMGGADGAPPSNG
jgi:chorismate-pyruvate lyase